MLDLPTLEQILTVSAPFAALPVVRTAFWAGGRCFGFTDPRSFHRWVIPGLRPIYRNVIVPLRDWKTELTGFGGGGVAGWTSIPDLWGTLLYKEGDALIGRLRIAGIPWNQYLGTPSQRHRVLVAGARSGKTTFLATELALRRGPALIVDPKLQLTEILARKLSQQGKTVRVMAPYGGLPPGVLPASWNLFAEARRFEAVQGGPDAIPGFFMKACEALIQPFSSDPFWPGSARCL